MSIRRVKLRKRFANFLRNPDYIAQEEERLDKKALQQEKGIFKSEQWANLVIGDYNPDKIDIPTYKRMFDFDAQVRAGVDILEMGVIGVPWKIQHDSQEIEDFITWSFDRMRRPSFYNALQNIMTALPFGFSVTESVWEYSVERKKYTLRKERGLKTFDPETIKFYTEQKGKLLRVSETIGGTTVDLPIDRSLIWSYNSKFGNWYGESLLKACYKNWFIKDNMLKFANIAFERFGAPILLGVAKDVKAMDEVEETLKHLYARSVGTIVKRSEDDPTDIKVLESRRASMPFMEYIDYHNKQILLRMLIGEPILRGGGGVYGPRIPFSILQERFKEVRLGVASALDDLLDLIVQLNFDTDKPAKIVFGPVPEAAVEEKVEKALSTEVDLS